MTRVPAEVTMILALFVSAALAGCSRTRPVEPETPPAASAAGGESPDADPIVCEKEEVPGSRMRKRVCRRQSETRAQREANQRGVRQARPEPPPAPGPSM
jgi:hypothetical protein